MMTVSQLNWLSREDPERGDHFCQKVAPPFLGGEHQKGYSGFEVSNTQVPLPLLFAFFSPNVPGSPIACRFFCYLSIMVVDLSEGPGWSLRRKLEAAHLSDELG
jgi:hypothetical protein